MCVRVCVCVCQPLGQGFTTTTTISTTVSHAGACSICGPLHATKLRPQMGRDQGRLILYLQINTLTPMVHPAAVCWFHGFSCHHPQTHRSLTADLQPRCADRVTDRLCRLEQHLKHLQVFGPFTMRFCHLPSHREIELTEYNCQSVFRSAVPLGC